MEFFFLLAMLVLVTLSIYLALHIFITKHKPQPNTNDKKIPLPPGRTGWPLIGESLDYYFKIQNGAIEKFVTERKNKYSSKVFRTSLIGEPMAVLCGPQGNKFLFSNEKKLVQVWFPSSIDKIFPKSNAASNHESFLRVRRMVPSFLKADALRRYVGVMDTVMKRRLQADCGGDHVKVSLMVRKYTITLGCRLFLSIDDPKEVEKFAKPIGDIEAGIISLPINLPGTSLNRAIRASKVICNAIETIIKQRKIDLMEKIGSQTEDILSHMLLTTDEDGNFLNESDISSHLLGLLHAGYSTLNSTLTFIMKYLAELPHVYQEVLREQTGIANSKEPKELLNWEDLRKMKYSWNVANEVLRLTPPGTGAFREAITDFTYAGYVIPKGWKLHWIACGTHKDPEYFPNPEKFEPSRFEGNGPTPYTFVPFGGGPRMCPGNEYARLAILVFMHNMVEKFRWEQLIPNEKVLNDPVPRPAQGLPIRLHRHKP